MLILLFFFDDFRPKFSCFVFGFGSLCLLFSLFQLVDFLLKILVRAVRVLLFTRNGFCRLGWVGRLRRHGMGQCDCKNQDVEPAHGITLFVLIKCKTASNTAQNGVLKLLKIRGFQGRETLSLKDFGVFVEASDSRLRTRLTPWKSRQLLVFAGTRLG